MKRTPLSALTTVCFAFILALPLLLTPVAVQAEITSIADAINKSGRQRMLTQRILSAYYQIGTRVNLTNSKQQLSDAVALFESQLNELKTYANSAEMVARQRERDVLLDSALAQVSRLWAPVKAIVSEEVVRSRAEELRSLNEDLLKASHAVVLGLQTLSDSESGRLVNIAGRQRMLSQRLSSLYILKSWGFTDPEYDAAYTLAIKEYRAALDELKSAPINTRKIKYALADVEKYFQMFENSDSTKVSTPSIIRRSAEKLLQEMNDVTMLYQIESEKLQK
jgi:hypothetical protein